MLIRAARTTNMLLHSALELLQARELAARKEASGLDGMRRQAKSLRADFDAERAKSIHLQLQASGTGISLVNKMQVQSRSGNHFLDILIRWFFLFKISKICHLYSFWRTVKVGVPKKVVFSKISAHVSVSNKSIS
jgi:hypothetical protein